MTTITPKTKAIQPPLPYDEWWDEWNEWDDNEIVPALVNIILGGTLGGVSQFAHGMTFDMDWTTANQHAAKWAREHAGQLIKDLNDTSSKIIKDAISAFIETPGMTVGDIIDQITQTGFGEVRAGMIATTETTTAYAQGQLLAAQEMNKENPDLTLYKTWFTDKDDRVCEICLPNEDVEVEWDQPFPSGDMDPPGHVNCRCWIDYRTRINK